MNDLEEGTGGYSMGVVTRRTGLSPDVLRVWERRYAVVTPLRTAGGQRLYSAADIEKLRLLRRLVEGGHRIASVAKLDLDALTTLAREVEVPAPASAESTPSQQRNEALLDAVARLDAAALEAGLRRSAISLGAETWVNAVVGPLLSNVGTRWHAGTLTPAHEHLASAVSRDVMAWVVKSFGVDGTAPGLLVATPAGELHELGALMAAVIGASAGWRIHYLGPNVPAADLARAARQLGVAAVALSIVHPDHAAAAVKEVKAVRASLPGAVPVIVGGAGAEQAAASLTAAGATIVTDTAAFRSELAGITRER